MLNVIWIAAILGPAALTLWKEMSGAKERKVIPPGHPGLGAAKWQEERSLFARRAVLDASRESVRNAESADFLAVGNLGVIELYK